MRFTPHSAELALLARSFDVKFQDLTPPFGAGKIRSPDRIPVRSAWRSIGTCAHLAASQVFFPPTQVESTFG